jgi:hypothetical protein
MVFGLVFAFSFSWFWGMGGMMGCGCVVMVVVVVVVGGSSCKYPFNHWTSSPAVSLCRRTRKLRVLKLRTVSQASRAPMTLPRCTRCAFNPAIQSVPTPAPVPGSVPVPLLWLSFASLSTTFSSPGPCWCSRGRQVNTPHSKSPCPPRYLVPLCKTRSAP